MANARRRRDGARAAGARRETSASRRRGQVRTGPRRELEKRIFAGTAVVLAVLVAAALVPIELLGASATGIFPAGNPVGTLGNTLDRAVREWVGAGWIGAPLIVLAGALAMGGWWRAERRRSLWIVSVALMVLPPVCALLAGVGEDSVGVVGGFLGEPLRSATGWFGAWVVVAGVVVSTWASAFGLGSLRGPARLAALAGGGRIGLLRNSLSRRWTELGELRAQRRNAARDRPNRSRREGGRTRRERRPRGRRSRRRVALAAASPVVPAPTVPRSQAPAAQAGSLAQVQQDRSSEPSAPGTESPTPATRPYTPSGPGLPGTALLRAPERSDRVGMERDLDHLGEVLIGKLATFGIRCEIRGRVTGPAVTRYEVVPEPGVKVSRIASLDADLALAMKARSVRIVAPIPGKGAVGVEIPNPQPQMVRLREIIEEPIFARSTETLPLALGRDLTGQPYVADLAKMPHALIAGATGSGKSVCLNTIITSLVYRHGPDRLRLLLVDPKMVELSAYVELPHLRHPVVTDPRQAAGVLRWAVMEMERRYALLSANGVRSLGEFNERVERGGELRLARPGSAGGDDEALKYEDGPLPWIVVVVDELADLMMTVQAEVEKPLTQLAQKARAIGIHLLVATQRPSVNVITGLIKANFPCRIAFRVASKTDSRTILDQNGAESLLGAGDMLFLPPGQSEPVRMQGAFVSTNETEELMGWFREQADTLDALRAKVASRERDILEEMSELEADEAGGFGADGAGDWDLLFREAAKACIEQGAGSTSLLQRRLRIGYGRAARIVDQLHDAGVLGPPDGSRPREVLVGAAGLDEICPS